ncbi:phosphoribosylanthranilate isomerase [Flavobacterium sp.]|uniref:phosphoribosylanthranilate isomerase n=1 Tax=Flavobacterium sp. TaxID=239 RepID=UPI003C6EDF6A
MNNSTQHNTTPPFRHGGKTGVGIKICGMKYPDNIVALGALLPDYMGFIFWEKSARNFEGIIPALPSSIKKTGVFVNETVANIVGKVFEHDLQAVQLHGKESVAYCTELKSELKKSKPAQSQTEIIKVFSILDDFNFDVLAPFESVCDYFLFDTKGKLPGGNGTTFDWTVLKDYPSSKPFILSGGIGLDEMDAVNEILKTNLPIYVIDLNSKLEIEPGLKNIQLCKDVINCISNIKK